ncbi:tetratricopeptide repeat protein [Bosea sp. 685]|uniref:tetratricopeptide repeat protein n=1 Tax=Bosea sp. 685 TaxID=3080057 RepID=UPI002893764D|nr:hypothetical protein [Bosea sp. 685]WNJ89394.1 hypothetical protein RMR04_23725 [Bosea sp. 685]
MIRAGLDRVLASDLFRGAPQLSAFLTFIVDRALDGRSAELKGYTVAVEAFGRPPDFDPQSDPIVRVEAGRLRKALGQYYLGEGADDPVRIAIPVGAYVPAFEVDERAGVEAEPAAAAAGDAVAREEAPRRPDAAVSRRWLLGAGLALLLGLASLASWYRIRDDEPPAPGARALQPSVLQPSVPVERAVKPTMSSAAVHLPVLSLMIGELPPDPAAGDIARQFVTLLADAIAGFDDLVTVKAPLDPRATTADADYVFELSAARFGDVTESAARLRAAKDGRIVWTASTNRRFRFNVEDPELPEIARRMAIRLAEPFGVIHADFRQAATSPAMRCIFQALDFRRTMKAEDHLAARTCLEGVLEKDPNFHAAWSQLALLTLDEYTAGLNLQPGPPLDRALSAALNAVRLAPSSARAQQAMMDVLFARGQPDEALAAGREAMARNPYDPDIMADLGARFVQLNRSAEGLPLLERAVSLSSGRPPWYDFFAFLGARLTGANKMADTYAARLLANEGPLSLLGRALHYAGAGDQAGFVAAVSGLAEASPLFRVDPRLFLERRGFSPPVVERIMSDLGPTTLDLIKRP